MTTSKPPVPSDEEDERIVDALFAEATRNRKTTRMVPESRIAELEAEVAEMRDRIQGIAGLLEVDASDIETHIRYTKDWCERQPRRTPELTERVARHLLAEYGTEYDGTPWEDLTDSGRAWFLEEADAVLGLVFGKERE